MTIHTIAYAQKGRILAKCGAATDIAHARAFNPTCPECQDPTRWPTAEQQVAAGFETSPGSGKPFDKLMGRQP